MLSFLWNRLFIKPFYKPILGLIGTYRLWRYPINENSFVVICHDASLFGGASVAIYGLIKDLGIQNTVVLFQRPGPLMEAFSSDGFQCFMVYKYARLVAWVLASVGVRRVFVNTLVLKRFVRRIEECCAQSHIVWWIHENNVVIDKQLSHDSWIPKKAQVVAVCSRVAMRLRHYGWQCEDIIPWLVRTNPKANFHTNRDSVSGTREFKICVVGPISRLKNPIEVIQACELLPQAVQDKLMVSFYGPQIGDAQYLSRFHKFVRTREFTQYCGVFDRGQIADIYLGNDLLICPSRDDSLPLVVAEAIQHGCGVVVSDATGFSDAIENGKTGFVYPLHHIEKLADCILCFLMRTDRNAMSELALQMLQSRYSPDSICARFSRLISET